MLSEMQSKDADIERMAEKALQNGELITELLDGLEVKDETYRYNCYRVLFRITESHGSVLYGQWDYFVGLLHSDNSYRKMSGIQLLANLVRVDTENRFEQILDSYYDLLNDKSMIVAIYVANTSGKIVKAKPRLEPVITDKLLNIGRTYHSEDRKQLIKAGVIEAFDQYFPESVHKERILDFVRKSGNSSSPKTRKLVQNFLAKWQAGI